MAVLGQRFDNDLEREWKRLGLCVLELQDPLVGLRGEVGARKG